MIKYKWALDKLNLHILVVIFRKWFDGCFVVKHIRLDGNYRKWSFLKLWCMNMAIVNFTAWFFKKWTFLCQIQKCPLPANRSIASLQHFKTTFVPPHKPGDNDLDRYYATTHATLGENSQHSYDRNDITCSLKTIGFWIRPRSG